MILDAEKLGKDHSKTESGQSACENWFSQASPFYGEVIDYSDPYTECNFSGYPLRISCYILIVL